METKELVDITKAITEFTSELTFEEKEKVFTSIYCASLVATTQQIFAKNGDSNKTQMRVMANAILFNCNFVMQAMVNDLIDTIDTMQE